MATILEALRYAVGKLNDGDLAEVERIGKEVLKHEPCNADALHLLGLAARKQEHHEQAVELFRQAIDVKPHKAVYYFELGVALRLAGDLEGAFENYLKAIDLDPKMHSAYVNAGAALDDMGCPAEALEWYSKALQLKPDCISTHSNMGNSLQSLGRFEESIASYRRALALDPSMAAAHWNLAMALLRSGNFREGWQEYEWRGAANETKLDVYPQEPWDGSPLSGKTILVHAEQGIGDEILFASCYPDLIEQAGHCIFICEPRLATLFGRSFPQATVIGYRRRHERTPCEVEVPADFQIPAGSLPRFLRPDISSFPARHSYLRPDFARVQQWRERFAALGPGLKIGISWRAGGKPSEQVRRTTDLALWRKLFALPGVHFVNLQYGQAAEDLARARQQGFVIHDWDDADALTDLDNLAAMICALDLVISVGNTTVHLAGSLGAPAWSLVAANPSWRWMDDVEQVPWYTSVRLFRQPRGESWTGVFDRVHRELCQLAGIDPSHGADIVPAAAEEPLPPEGAEADSLAAMRIPAQVSGMKFVARLTEMIERAVKHHQAGELDQAEAIYRQVLQNTPQHADALHLLGVVCQQTGRHKEALRHLRQAIALNDCIPGFHFHLGMTHKEMGQTEEAIASYRRAVELKPDFCEAHLNIGAALQEKGRLDEAIECYLRALELNPSVAGIHLNLGAARRALRQYDLALMHLERALELQPKFPEARVQLGLLHQDQRNLQAAVEHFQQALTDKPDHAGALRCMGKALLEQQRWDEAIVCFQQALEYKPRDYESAANLGVAFEQQEQYALAEESYRRALAISPHEQTRLRRITVLQHLGRLDEALQACDELLQQDPQHVVARWTRAQVLLQQGDLKRGFADYAWRWRLPGHEEPTLGGVPVWDGKSLDGKSILVHVEAALGESLVFLPCLTPIIRQARQTTLRCDRRLAGLLARSFPTARVELADTPITSGATADQMPFDCQATLGRLPEWLGFDAEHFHSHRVALAPDAGRSANWARRLGGELPKVGILWRGRHKTNVQCGTSRSPALECWRQLLEVDGARFIGLLPEAAQDELAALGGEHLNLLPNTHDLDELAAQISALDLVICVDDLMPHLAASLGKPVWLVLPFAWGWQWPLVSDVPPWYANVRLFRPSRPMAWPGLMVRLQQHLAEWLAAPSRAIDPPHGTAHAPHLPSAPVQTGPARLTMKERRS